MRVHLVALLLLCLACTGGTVVEVGGTNPPVDTARGPGSGGTVQRSTLTARVIFDLEDAPLASMLGIGVGDLTVRLLREGTLSASAVATTDSLGVSRFENLLEGRYALTVERPLSDGERARLPLDARDATVLAGGASVILSPPISASTTLSLVGARRGSLVISEQYGYTGVPTPYNWGMYMEFYNNGDTTVYMDGMLLVRESLRLTQPNSWAPCDHPAYVRYRRDTTRIWVESGIRFPGSGREFPVRPGESRVYAQDAANHRLASGSGLFIDLSRADFEQVGDNSDIDNPLAANVAPMWGTGNGAGGRGMRTNSHTFWVLVKGSALARVTPATLTRVSPPPDGAIAGPNEFQIYGIPREDVIDVMSLGDSPGYRALMATTSFGDVQSYDPPMESVFDRAPAPISDYRTPVASRRRSIGRTADGRLILMRTRTSARDIEAVTGLRERFP